jgi:hypothetical protein
MRVHGRAGVSGSTVSISMPVLPGVANRPVIHVEASPSAPPGSAQTTPTAKLGNHGQLGTVGHPAAAPCTLGASTVTNFVIDVAVTAQLLISVASSAWIRVAPWSGTFGLQLSVWTSIPSSPSCQFCFAGIRSRGGAPYGRNRVTPAMCRRVRRGRRHRNSLVLGDDRPTVGSPFDGRIW